MNTNNFWGKSRSTGMNVGLIVRIGLATLSLIGSVVLAWALLSPHQGAHASPNIPTPTTTATSIPSPTTTATSTPSPTPTGTPLPNLPPGPVHPTWYFAEGKVGQGFTEFLTIQNPDPVNACNITIQYLLSSSTLNPISLTIQPDTRWTEGVNNDLGIAAGSTSYQAVS
ncbi:MAG TPA: hypothetical protein VNW73_10720, partial [Ktedonobacteraceae bacterium]|nr:hypothetical protein [Ktedonobacteraceae bacterium]